MGILDKTDIVNLLYNQLIMNQMNSYTLPKLKASKNTPEGFKMIPEDNPKILLVSCFILNCIFSAIGFFGLGALIYYFSNNLQIAKVTCLVGFILKFLYSAVWSLRLYNRRKFENPGELLVSEHPLKLGGSYQIHYRRPLRSGATLNQNVYLKAVLRCSEVVTYYVGTDRETVRQIILEEPLINQTVLADTQEIEFKTSIEIPNNSAPSLQTYNNCILWTIEVELNKEKLVFIKKQT
ncbi:hypothetical protein CYANOKiyG1_46650 [Okeania sp. KiyG1]|nr:hypothetical protein CYANOKiyG1_46650 [Okeania sp. KiyG1]